MYKTDGDKIFKDLLKVFLSKFYLEILRWSFVAIGNWCGIFLAENE